VSRVSIDGAFPIGAEDERRADVPTTVTLRE
jgi:hypothetical protein